MDRPLYNDRNKMKALVKSGEILEEVEKAPLLFSVLTLPRLFVMMKLIGEILHAL